MDTNSDNDEQDALEKNRELKLYAEIHSQLFIDL